MSFAAGELACEDERKTIYAFRCGKNQYKVRLYVNKTGKWDYQLQVGEVEIQESIECVSSAKKEAHGMVCAEGYHFSYEDGKRYLPFGTTAYAWIYQPAERQEQTIKTLKNNCFNKIRIHAL